MREANLEIIKNLKAFLVQVKEDPSLRHHFASQEAFTKNRKPYSFQKRIALPMQVL
ncbi:MAG: hypothetical protein H7069_13175 [Phormidesmis sp. FL-bin-119]|nr:hypothetical protein [Pedobacter sp.]